MRIKGIIFSKDGVLVDFNRLWVESTFKVVEELINNRFPQATNEEKNKKNHQVLDALGVSDRRVSDTSVISNGTVADIAEIIMKTLDFQDDDLAYNMEEFYFDYIKENNDQIRPIVDLKEYFEKLKSFDYKIAIVTNSSREITQWTLNKLGVLDKIDFIASYDEYPKKPDFFTIDELSARFYLKRKEIIVVGDTKTDMEYAKPVAFGVGVLSGTGSEEYLSNFTDYLIKDVTKLIDDEGKVVFEEDYFSSKEH